MVYYHLTSKISIYFERSKKYQKKFKFSAMLAQRLLSNSCTNLINHLKNIAFFYNLLARHRKPAKHFIRTRKKPFSTLIVFMINLIKGPCRDELDRFLYPSEIFMKLYHK